MGLLSHKARQAPSSATAVYVRHRPETTLLYQIVQVYWPEFQAELASHGRHLPTFITKEFDEYLKCGRLEHGFLRVRCESCHDEKLVAFSCKRRGHCLSHHRHALGAQSGLYKTHDTDGCSDSDPEIWWGAQSQHPFSYAISGWGVHRWFYWASHVVSTGKGTKQR